MTYNNMWNGSTYSIRSPMVYTRPLPKYNYGELFKAEMAGNNTCNIIFVLDKSASMQTVRESTIVGFNNFIKTQKQDSINSGIKTYMNLYTFDGYGVSSVYKSLDILETKELNYDTYNPQGHATNLLDGIGSAMVETNATLLKTPPSLRSSVIFVILTDGEENFSSVYSDIDIKKMVMKSTESKWGFMFLGANIDSFKAGANYGFGTNNTIQLSGSGSSFDNGMAAASAMTTRMKSVYASSDVMSTEAIYNNYGFTDDERKDALK